MKTVFCSFGLLMAAVPVFAQNTGKDSIVSTKALDDVVVSASNISRVGDHLVIYPNSQQRKHAVNGFGVLENLNIPGLIIDTKSNQVKSIKDQTASQYASIKVAYSFDFGRKTQKVEKDVNKNINSSLLRVE